MELQGLTILFVIASIITLSATQLICKSRLKLIVTCRADKKKQVR